ncbi:MAG: ATP-binding cassette domain-containing protein, partial [Bdellovibrionia bacterium]
MLEVISVTKSFQNKTAVDGVDLTVQSGEFLSILGPSGCGKTTLLRLIGGLERADRGTLKLDGQDITRVDAHKRNIHTVFQRYALFPHMNVFDNIAFGLRCKKVAEHEI